MAKRSAGAAGKHKGEQDERAGVLEDVLSYIERAQPTCFILENVPRLLAKKHRHPDANLNFIALAT